MNILWLADIHLDFLFPKERRDFLSSLDWTEPDFVFVGGDISNSATLEDDLRAIRKATKAQVYFVLGNHDYFGSSISIVRDKIRKLPQECTSLHWLEDMSQASLLQEVALVGHGCWGDAGIGSYWKSELHRDMPDFREIAELKVLNSRERLDFMKQLGDEAARYLEKSCRAAAKRHCQVIVLTHVPLFPQSLVRNGKMDESGYPFFCCLSAGKALRAVAEACPDVRFTVLSGHTHQESRVRILPNLEAIVKGTRIHKPDSRLLSLENGMLIDRGNLEPT